MLWPSERGPLYNLSGDHSRLGVEKNSSASPLDLTPPRSHILGITGPLLCSANKRRMWRWLAKHQTTSLRDWRCSSVWQAQIGKHQQLEFALEVITGYGGVMGRCNNLSYGWVVFMRKLKVNYHHKWLIYFVNSLYISSHKTHFWNKALPWYLTPQIPIQAVGEI